MNSGNVIGRSVSISDKARVVKSTLRDYARVKDYAELTNSTLGEYSYLAQFSIVNKTEVGKFCSIGHGAYIGLWEHNMVVSTHSFYLYESSGGFVKGYKDYDKCAVSTYIGSDVWVGANSVILKGKRIGDGAIVGAGAVVTKDVPPYAITVGNPAKIIKYRFAPEEIDFLLKSQWWDYPRDIVQQMVDDEAFYSIETFKDFIRRSGLEGFKP